MTEPTTPEEIAEAKAEAKRLRRQRQTAKNLVASLVASLGIVIFLVLVVARPDEQVAEPIDYAAVGAEAETESGYDLAIPVLDETWSSNRADLREESTGDVWRVGLISTSGGFVQIVHYLNTDDITKELPEDGVDGIETLISLNGASHEWSSRDRSGIESAGNDVYLLWTPVSNGHLVLRSTSQASVLSIASQLLDAERELFGGSE
jgi:hypothetical protein